MRALEMSTQPVVTADASLNLTAAARLMREHGVGDVVVTDDGEAGGRPLGVVTDRDIVVHAIAHGVQTDEITVSDLRMSEPVSVPADADLAEIAAAMSEHGVRRLIVTDGGGMAGMLSLDSVIIALAETTNDLAEMFSKEFGNERKHLVDADGSREDAAATSAS